MRVLVCGDRNWQDAEIIWTILDGLSASEMITIIEGQCPYGGADKAAADYAEAAGMDHLPFPADWENRPRWAAGPERNQRMLDEGQPHVVLAFKDNFNWKLDKGGTEDMVKRAKAAGLPVYVISRA